MKRWSWCASLLLHILLLSLFWVQPRDTTVIKLQPIQVHLVSVAPAMSVVHPSVSKVPSRATLPVVVKTVSPQAHLPVLPPRSPLPLRPQFHVKHILHHHEPVTKTAPPVLSSELQHLLSQALSSQPAHTQVASQPTPVVTTTHAAVADPDYVRTLRAHIYQFAVVPLNTDEAGAVVYRVHQDRRGRVIQVEKVRGSGILAYDDAVYRAIVLASPLPLPQDARLFQSVVVVTFYPGEHRS